MVKAKTNKTQRQKCSIKRQDEAKAALEYYYRDNNKAKLKGKDLVFQALDWKEEDLSAGYEDNDGFDKLKYTLKAFGVTPEGHSVCLTINEFCPYFFVKVPSNWGKNKLAIFTNWMKEKREWDYRLKQQGRKLGESLVNSSVVKRKDFYGFHNNELFTFFRFDFDNLTAMKTAIKLFVKGEKVEIIDPKKKNLDIKRGKVKERDSDGNIINSDPQDLLEDMQEEDDQSDFGSDIDLSDDDGDGDEDASKVKVKVKVDNIKKKATAVHKEKDIKLDKKNISIDDEDSVQYEYRSYYQPLDIMGLKRQQIYPLYESNLPSILRFMHLKELLPAGWLRVCNKKYKKCNVSYCNIDVQCSWKNILSAENDVVDPNDPSKGKFGDIIPPILQASFDIECYSDTGSFPQPDNDNHCIFQIATAFKSYGDENFCLKHIITLKESKKMIRSSNLYYDILVDKQLATKAYHESELVKHEDDRDKKSDNVDPVDRWVEDWLKKYKALSGYHVSRVKGKASDEEVLAGKDKYQFILRCFEYNDGPPPDLDIIAENFEKYLATEEISAEGAGAEGAGAEGAGAKGANTGKIIVGDISSDSVPVIIECYDTEKEVLLAWQRLIKRMDPDILYTYNGDKFDCNYMYIRAQKCKIEEQFSDLSRLRDHRCYITEEKFESGAYGTHHYKRLLMPGRINFDLLIYIQREQKLELYKLDYVAEKFLKDNKDPVSAKEMFKRFAKGTPEDIKIVAEYCIQDTDLPQRLIDKLDVLPIYIEMAKVTCVPMSYLLYMGQQIKVFSQIVRKSTKEGYLVPHYRPWKWDPIKKEIVRVGDSGKFKGATVLNAISGAYYEPVTTLDFASLYPTLMMANKLCYTSYVEELNGPYNNVPGVEYFDVIWDENEEILNDSGESYTPPKYTGKKNKYHYRYAQHDDTILPVLLSELYKTRKMVKKMMSKEKDPFKKSILNGRQLAIKVTMNSVYGFLAAQKICCKPIAASVTTIGRQMIEGTQRFAENDFVRYVKEYVVSEIDKEKCSIVLKNPKTGDEERDIFVEKCVINEFKLNEPLVLPNKKTGCTKCDVTAVYGDTDSVFLVFRTDTKGKHNQMVEAFKLGMVAGRLITRKLFKDPIDLEFEKVYYPLILIGKKMYIGALHEHGPGILSYIDTKGVALKRRNYCHWVKDICNDVVDLLMDPKLEKFDPLIVSNAEQTVRGHLDELIDGEVNLKKLTMTASLKDKYKSENVPHYQLKKKMAERESAGLTDLPTPESGDRIPFVYIQSNKSNRAVINESAMKYEKIEHPAWATEHKLPLDVLFYIESQLFKPISQIFTPLVDDPEATLNHYIVKSQKKSRGYGDITKFIDLGSVKNKDFKKKQTVKIKKPLITRNLNQWLNPKSK